MRGRQEVVNFTRYPTAIGAEPRQLPGRARIPAGTQSCGPPHCLLIQSVFPSLSSPRRCSGVLFAQDTSYLQHVCLP